MKLNDILQRPLITEKAAKLQQTGNEYSFRVDRRANKFQIRQAVEKLFQVRVVKVRTLTVAGKKRRVGRYIGKGSDWKKAIVKLNAKDTIKLFEGKA